MNKIIDVTNDDLDGDEVSDNDGDASNDVIELILNFTALNFISALDEVAFKFAKSGKYG